jgi:hypothetical protein
MAEQTRSECITTSYFVKYYFNSLIKRLDGNKKLLIPDYLIISSIDCKKCLSSNFEN